MKIKSLEIEKYKMYGLVMLIAWIICGQMHAQLSNGWRGPDRNGIYQETGLLKKWPEEGVPLLWSVNNAGKGYSSPVVVGNKIFVTGMDIEEKNEILTAYTIDGKQLYQVKYGKPWSQSYPETRTTPMVVEDRVYVISGIGEIVCMQVNDGSICWSVNGNEKFGAKTNTWGISESPLVFDNKVIFTPGGDQTTMVALDALTGETIWTTPSLNDLCSHVSPLLIVHNGRKLIIGFSEDYLYAVHPETGEMLWQYNDWDFVAERGMDGICINTPLYKDGRLFISNAYEMRSHMLELNEDGSAVRTLWRNDDLSVHTGGMVLVDHIIYGSNWFNNNSGNWVAVDWNTGATTYKASWPGGGSKGSVITADKMLYCYEERRGTVALVKPNAGGLDIVSQFRIREGEGPHWSHPVIDHGVLYIRHGSALMAYKIKE
ncbi:PQQ-binding-like beta-propeller repeat protein [Parabacteroides sp. PF5-9]|uniref:outer membrane protein assembly factor BamB family protein n=1 Tax=Parabacteroides sp. PF5-9 TaxID=1742404 RepID=UPI002475E7A0|nr:PQQ-binding-like beta-propeller repeat protein [Parabacteroides sp. PF5-9]MDH6358466.1 outer membrane protein assembly factor BamB [Parabacteroides sp. PF5-9]